MKHASKCRTFCFNYSCSGSNYICDESCSVSYIPEGERDSANIQYLGKVLTPAVIGMLVVYCLKNTSILQAPHGIPEAIAVAVTALLHVWKRNNLLSIGCGTILYMVLIQMVF